MNITVLTPDASGLVSWPTLDPHKRSIATIGVFDGMHQGHLAVLNEVTKRAQALNCLSVAILFDPRPATVHQYAASHDGLDLPQNYVDSESLMGLHERLRTLHALQFDHVIVVRYSLAFSEKSYRFFLGQLVGKLGLRTLVLGSDAALGHNRAGTIAKLRELAAATGVFEVVEVSNFGPGMVRIPRQVEPHVPELPGEPQDPTAGMTKAELRAWTKAHDTKEVRVWSSSNVRYLLSQGRVQDASKVLGHLHGIEGTVVHGQARGRELGFPTANLGGIIEGYIPVDGVYAGWLVDLGPAVDERWQVPERGRFDDGLARDVRQREMEGSVYRWPAAISIGTNPTFEDEDGTIARVVEPYAITKDWLELYDHRVRVEFAGFLNRMIKFDSVDELKAALGQYVTQTLEITGR